MPSTGWTARVSGKRDEAVREGELRRGCIRQLEETLSRGCRSPVEQR